MGSMAFGAEMVCNLVSVDFGNFALFVSADHRLFM